VESQRCEQNTRGAEQAESLIEKKKNEGSKVLGKAATRIQQWGPSTEREYPTEITRAPGSQRVPPKFRWPEGRVNGNCRPRPGAAAGGSRLSKAYSNGSGPNGRCGAHETCI